MTRRNDTGRPIVYLHIGAMKTGTTYLQQLLYANRSELRAAGLLVPGRAWQHQLLGVQDVLRLERRDPHIGPLAIGAWQALVDEALAHPDNVSVISVEFLSFASLRDVRRILRTLAGADVRVVLTVRDMAASLPSQWQTLAHNGGTWSWREYLAAVPQPVARPPRLPRRVRPLLWEFHRTLNVPRMLSVWGSALPAGKLHVVTVPRRRERPDELWRRFAQVLGVDPGVATRPAADTNPSLGYASSELVRRLNVRLSSLPRSEYDMTVKVPVALGRLAGRARREPRAQLTPAAYDLAQQWNALTRRVIEERGTQITGDLADLPTEPDPALRTSLPTVPPAPPLPAVLDAACDAALVLTRRTRRRRRKLVRAGFPVELARRPRVRTLRSTWERADDPVDAAARELADRAQEAALLLRQIRAEQLQGASLR